MGRRKTHAEFAKEVFDLVGDEYSVLDTYDGAKVKLKFIHNLSDCKHVFYKLPNNFLNGQYCPSCSSKKESPKKKSNEQFVREVFELVGDEYEVLGIYSGADNKVTIKHNKCNHEWGVIATKFTNEGTRCPKCAGNIKKTTEQFKHEVFKLVEDEYEVIGEYINSKEPIKILHKKCNNIISPTPDTFLHSCSCSICAESKGEKRVRHWMEKNNVELQPQKEFKGLIGVGRGNLSYDFYLPKQNILIEYQGEFHDGTAYQQTNEEFIIQQEHDKRKKEYAS